MPRGEASSTPTRHSTTTMETTTLPPAAMAARTPRAAWTTAWAAFAAVFARSTPVTAALDARFILWADRMADALAAAWA